MGYYTKYNMQIKDASIGEKAEMFNALEDIVGCDYLFEDIWKWYGHEEDVAKLSALYPDKLIALLGIGEEYPDIWRKFFLGGLCIVNENAEINLPKINGWPNNDE